MSAHIDWPLCAALMADFDTRAPHAGMAINRLVARLLASDCSADVLLIAADALLEQLMHLGVTMTEPVAAQDSLQVLMTALHAEAPRRANRPSI